MLLSFSEVFSWIGSTEIGSNALLIKEETFQQAILVRTSRLFLIIGDELGAEKFAITIIFFEELCSQ